MTARHARIAVTSVLPRVYTARRGGEVYHSNAPPSSHPVDPRHWTPPISFSYVVNPEPQQDWFGVTSLTAVRRVVGGEMSERMLQAAERRLNPEAGGG
ncbi:hypothetical protein AMECASPLE_012022 [Ameca splendens]|uniref:Uncharacterized protein n=1 Tax=Ameca splendens TaxID=208324 RepID=A0ABV1AAE6_9TELE